MKACWRQGVVLLLSLAWAVQLFPSADCSGETPDSQNSVTENGQESTTCTGVHLDIQENHVVMDNGILQVNFSKPAGHVTGIRYNGVDNILEVRNQEANRGYWDNVWTDVGYSRGRFGRIEGTSFKVIANTKAQVEISFSVSWNSSHQGESIPLNMDKRYVMLCGHSGFYSYAIYERQEGWPDFNFQQGRITFKLQQNMFHYMALSDERQRIMPMPEDRTTGQTLAYPEAVLLTHPINPALKGEVDDKYQYSCKNEENNVHGWISFNPPIGFWMITPSNEFRTGGPLKQDLTSHVGPITLSMFVSDHYAGLDLDIKFRDGEPWKKVFGPVFIYLNKVSDKENPLVLWKNAKEQMLSEVASWPYNFLASKDFASYNQRGTVSGRLLVRDSCVNKDNIAANAAYVGLARPGEVGSWQTENKGYQFWTRADAEGRFFIKNVISGDYNLYAWVPGVIGDYKYETNVRVTPGSKIDLGDLVYEPPRDGRTLWEIGIPDRSAAEFFVPEASKSYMNRLFVNQTVNKFRQYGLWERYQELHPTQDIVYTVGKSNYKKDWFFAHVTRKADNGYKCATWQIIFNLDDIDYTTGTYKLRVAIASATEARLEVRFNDPHRSRPHFETGLIGRDNAIARHGIHGLYRLYHIDVPGNILVKGENRIFLAQSTCTTPFEGIMYDYIRLERPSVSHSSRVC